MCCEERISGAGSGLEGFPKVRFRSITFYSTGTRLREATSTFLRSPEEPEGSLKSWKLTGICRIRLSIYDESKLQLPEELTPLLRISFTYRGKAVISFQKKMADMVDLHMLQHLNGGLSDNT